MTEELSAESDMRFHPRARQSMGAAERREWSAVVRRDTVLSVVAALKNPAFRGVATTGAEGVGKTTLAQSVTDELRAETYILHLRSPMLGSIAPYGQLAFLLAKLPAQSMASPTAIIHGVESLIRAEAAGQPALLVLDDPTTLDQMSVAVIMHLLLTGTCRILVLSRDITDLPEDFHWLIKDGQLEYLRLENFSRQEVVHLLEGVLRGPVTASVVTTFHASSGGNPLVLHAIVSEQLRSGSLHRRRSVWTMNSEVALGSVGALSDLVRSRLSRESPQAQVVIEYLALTRRLPLSVLVQLTDASIVAEMEEAAYLEVDESERRWVSLRDKYVGDVVRDWLDLERRRELHRRVAEVISHAPEQMSIEELLSYAAWTLDCQAPLAPGIALAAARAAVQFSDPIFALKCADEIRPEDAQWVAAAEQRAAAHMILADYEAAANALGDIRAETLERLPLTEYARHVLVRCSALLWIPGGRRRIPELLVQARAEVATRSEIDAAAPGRTVETARALDLIMLAEYEMLTHQGDYAAVSQALESGYRGEGDLEYRLNCGCLLVLGWAMTGRELDALELAAELTGEMQRSGIVPKLRSQQGEGLFAALLLTGQWQDCVAMLTDAQERFPQNMPYGGGAWELALGVAYTYAGRGDLALGPLLAAVAQLEVRSSFNSEALAYSALAFAYAQVGDAAEARNYLSQIAARKAPTAWCAASMATFCELMARRWLGDPGARTKLIQMAEHDAANGRYTAAGTSLFGATIHGSEQEYLLLEEISARRQGPMSELNRLVARGSRSKDAKSLISAAGMSRGLALDAVEARCVALAIDYARESGDAFSARAAQHRLDRLVEALPVLPVTPHSEGTDLTERELQVAEMACRGLRNRDIAARLEVSVRTVEGHLYQIFTKLGISARSEIEEILRK
ncbi:helix-turn-helix transcriptional regulator [Paenarthrobacter sp. Z7-10]|uniref:helix-turn-helix transcriptional regulator n=1 Tax=Paenarthrobacter sp. Z7-10 TaxID=2787635 RepID=UPI0022A95A6C|nr:LuxR family transcriptional regulator [Paenarthrobacter sp. Z7-10]MCZ2402963.1 helix-turn-helix transcriptional regulator [Paenarthrobacter sp. Z7-10]